jgi:tetratricopeptide (TPR) repeat protein
MRKILFLAVLVAFFAPPARAEDESRAHAARGDEYRREGRFEEAIAEYKEALRLSGVLEEAAALAPPRDPGWAGRRHRDILRLSAES